MRITALAVSLIAHSSNTVAKLSLFKDVSESALDVEFVHVGASFDVFPNSPVCSALPPEQQDDCAPQNFVWMGGVAIADLNGDGWDDMYVTNGMGGANALYLNLRQHEIRFKEIAVQAGVDAVGDESAGVAAGDMNNDGLIDLYVTNVGLGAPVPNAPPGLNRMFINQGNDENGIPVFVDVAQDVSGAGNANSRSQTVSLADFDADGDLDIFIGVHHTVVNPAFAADDPNYPVKRPDTQQSQLLRNLLVENGELTFEDSTNLLREDEAKGVKGDDDRPIFSSRFTFEGVWTDVDNDGDQDMLQANDLGEIGLFLNNKGDKFIYNSPSAGINDIGAWMTLTVGDVNADGYMDFFSTNVGVSTGFTTFENKLYALYMNDPSAPGTFSEVAETVGTDSSIPGSSLANPAQDGDTSGDFGWGAQWFDFDNDGDLDLFMVGNWFPQGFGVKDGDDGTGNGFSFPTSSTGFGHTNRGHLYENKGNDKDGNPVMVDLMQSAEDRSRVGLDNPFDARCVVVGDLNNDGLLDVVISNVSGKATNGRGGGFKLLGDYTGRLRVFRNKYRPLWNGVHNTYNSRWNRALHIRLVGVKSNRDGIGARVTVTSKSGRKQVREARSGEGHLGSNSPQLEFGLGSDNGVSSIVIEWPSGELQKLKRIKVPGRVMSITVKEGAGDWYEQLDNGEVRL